MKSPESHTRRTCSVDRHQQLEQFLRRTAPILAEACAFAQDQSAELGGTPWADKVIYRTSLLNRLIGTARWGIASEHLVMREDALGKCGMHCSTTYEEQNMGRFYWTIPAIGAVFTIR